MPTYKITYLAIIIISLFLGLWQWKRANRVVQSVTILLALTLLIEFLATYSAKVYKNNLWVYHFFNPIQFFLITYCFYIELRLKVQKISMYFVPLLFVIISIFIQPKIFPSYSISIGFTFYILWSLLYFRCLFTHTSERSLWSYPLFWISCGWLQFCTINLLQLGIFNFIVTSKDDINPLITNTIFNVRVGSNILLYSCYLIAILKAKPVFKD